MGSKRNKNRRSRRAFDGNQYSKIPESLNSLGLSSQPIDTEMEELHTESCKKIKSDHQFDSEIHKDFFFLTHTSILFHLLAVVGVCPDCLSDKLILKHDETKKMGLARNFIIHCNNSKWEHNFKTSLSLEQCYTPGRKGNSVNSQVAVAFREIGKCYNAIKSFCTSMGMLQPFMPKVFTSFVHKITTAYEKIASESMKNAAIETRGNPIDQGMMDCQVTIDGTWQKEGHSSLHGVVVGISREGKIIDCEVVSKHCKQCQVRSKKEGIAEYLERTAEHICKIHHIKS